MPDLVKRLRVTLYGRVSQDRGGDSKSVGQQLELGRNWASGGGHEVVGEYRDDNVSASKYARGKKRDDWPKVMEDITAGRTDALWVWEISRTTRDRPVWAALLAACEANEVLIVVDGRMHDPNDPDDGFMLDLSAMLGVRESRVTSKRIRRDVRARATAGRPHGRLAYGYKRQYTVRPDGTRVLDAQVPDPEVAPLIREAGERFARGEALYAIAADFTARGVPRPQEVRAVRLEQAQPVPGPWTPNQLRRVIASPTNAGIRTLRGEEVVAGAWEPIIPVDVHHQIVAKLGDPRRRTQRDSSAKHLLAAIAVCGVCGSPCRRVKNRGCPSYACWGGKGTGCVARKQEWVDQVVVEAIVERVRRSDPVDLLGDDADDDVQVALEELARLEAKLQGAYDLWGRDELSDAGLAQREKRLEPLIEGARVRARRSAGKPTVQVMKAARDPQQWWDRQVAVPGGMSVLRPVVREMTSEVRIDPAKPGSRTPDPSTISVLWAA